MLRVQRGPGGRLADCRDLDAQPGQTNVNYGHAVQGKHWLGIAGTPKSKVIRKLQSIALADAAQVAPQVQLAMLKAAPAVYVEELTKVGGKHATGFSAQISIAAFKDALPAPARAEFTLAKKPFVEVWLSDQGALLRSRLVLDDGKYTEWHTTTYAPAKSSVTAPPASDTITGSF